MLSYAYVIQLTFLFVDNAHKNGINTRVIYRNSFSTTDKFSKNLLTLTRYQFYRHDKIFPRGLGRFGNTQPGRISCIS